MAYSLTKHIELGSTEDVKWEGIVLTVLFDVQGVLMQSLCITVIGYSFCN